MRLDSAIEGAIALGSLIESPAYADQPVNDPPITIDDKDITKPATRTDCQLKTGSTLGGSTGLWTDFLQPVTDISGNTSIEAKSTKEQELTYLRYSRNAMVPTDPQIHQGKHNRS